jgi:hypothetical protein
VEHQAYTHLAKQLGSVYVEKYIFLALDLSKKGLISLHRENGKRPSVQDSNGEANLAITDAP